MARCKGTNRKGKRCGSNSKPGAEYCAVHQDQTPKDNNITNIIKKTKAPKEEGNKTLSNNLKKKPRFNVIRELIVFLSIALNFWLGYHFILPRITVNLIMPSNKGFPFESHINVTNNGHFLITNVVCSLENQKHSASVKTPLTMYTHDPEGKLIGERVVTFPEIKAGHSEPLELAKMFGLVSSRADSASFTLEINFKPRFLPNKTQTYQYKLFKTVDGNYNWLESTN